MKKIYFLFATFLLTGSLLKAQDTLLFEDFELTNFYNNILIDCNATFTTPPAIAADTNWYSMDSDGTPDGSTAGTRPDGWFATMAFSTVDQYTTIYGTIPAPDTNTVICANSWTNTPTPEANWLITRSIQLGLADTLFWKSAPYQTPRYMDGYQVLISTTTNADNTSAFSTVLFNAAEMTALGSDSTYSTYTFAATGAGGPTPFVHGLDGNNIDWASTTAPISHRGQLRQFSVPLDAYANANVFIAFLDNTTDDNLLEIDDVMIRGKLSTIGIKENVNDLALNLFPNPASDNVQVSYTLTAETTVTINLYDVTGKLVASDSKGAQDQGRHFAHINTSDLAKGFYTVKVATGFGQSTSKLIVR
ncbi:MAG: T9SS type A sorting domain-containing protein [Bacteroidetes bacterium]|nr:T9SS type A sorting domain-containing protein [Bacteroidota bacterium]